MNLTGRRFGRVFQTSQQTKARGRLALEVVSEEPLPPGGQLGPLELGALQRLSGEGSGWGILAAAGSKASRLPSILWAPAQTGTSSPDFENGQVSGVEDPGERSAFRDVRLCAVVDPSEGSSIEATIHQLL